jgi:Uma2 family endonuclease
MSVEMVSNDRDWERMLQTWRELDVPEGWRAEILEGGITLTPGPGHGHNKISDRVHRALVGALGFEWIISQATDVAIPELLRLYRPDFTVFATTVIDRDPDGGELGVENAELVVEIVSRSNARTDRVEKLWAFGQAGVPLYLLIDRFDADGPSVTLYSDPADGHYRQIHKVPFGKPVELPEPIGLTLETSDFSRR